MRTKVCSKCKIEKSISEYIKDCTRIDGFRYECKDCYYIYKKSKKGKAATKRYRQGKAGKATQRRGKIKYNYGIDYNKYLLMAEYQKYCCAICNLHLSELTIKNLQVDHCHITGKVRGLLCGNCNKALGLMKDNLNSIKNMYKYIKGSK